MVARGAVNDRRAAAKAAVARRRGEACSLTPGEPHYFAACDCTPELLGLTHERRPARQGERE